MFGILFFSRKVTESFLISFQIAVAVINIKQMIIQPMKRMFDIFVRMLEHFYDYYDLRRALLIVQNAYYEKRVFRIKTEIYNFL